MAAQLACGSDAFACRRSAGAVWGFWDDVDIPEISVPCRTQRVHHGIIVHRTHRVETVKRNGFRVSTPMRTLLDLAAVLPPDLLERTLDTAHRRGLIELRRFRAYLDVNGHRALPGSGDLRRMVAARDPDAAIASDLETLFFVDLRRVRLPLPVPQYRVVVPSGRKRYIDFAYPSERVAIELDSYAEHGGPKPFVSDRVRRNEVEAMRWHFLHFTWEQVKSGSVSYLMPLADILDLEPCRWRKKSGAQPRSAGALRGQSTPS